MAIGKLNLQDRIEPSKILKSVEIMGKQVDIPVHYTDLSALMLFFQVSVSGAKNFIDSSRFKLVKTFGNRCVLGLTVFNYKECPVGPYRELAISFPVLKDAIFPVPLLPLIFDNSFKNAGFFAHLLSMSTQIGIDHSKEIFGYPTYDNIITVDFEDEGKFIDVNIQEEDELILSFSMNKPKSFKEVTKRYNTFYSHAVDENLVSVSMDVAARVGTSYRTSSTHLTLGRHKISSIIRDLIKDSKPIAIQYYPEAIEILHAPIRI